MIPMVISRGEQVLPDTADDLTISRARDGDERAVAELWEIYQPQVLRVLRSRRSVAPEDVASQVWLEVTSRMGSFEGDGEDFRAWLFTLAKRRAIDDSRRPHRRHESIGGDDREADRPTSPSAELVAVDLEAGERALELIDLLRPTVAEAVTLRVVHGLAFAEIATLTGRTEGGARTLVHRGLAELRRAVEALERVADEERTPDEAADGGAGVATRDSSTGSR